MLAYPAAAPPEQNQDRWSKLQEPPIPDWTAQPRLAGDVSSRQKNPSQGKRQQYGQTPTGKVHQVPRWHDATAPQWPKPQADTGHEQQASPRRSLCPWGRQEDRNDMRHGKRALPNRTERGNACHQEVRLLKQRQDSMRCRASQTDRPASQARHQPKSS